MTWALKPGAPASAHDRLAALAHAIDNAHDEPSRDIRQLLVEAQHVAADVFLDPAIPEMLRAPAPSDAYDDVARVADRLSSALRRDAGAVDAASVPLSAWPSTLRGGERLLHYRLIRRLGGGGMGTILLAWDERLDRYVALKRLADEQPMESGYRRLEREARAGARLRHPNVVITYTLEYVAGEPVLVQEFIDGVDLADRVGTLAPREAITVAAQIAAGVAAAHAAGILHRDLKPQNVRLRRDGTAVILDFGLGKAFLATPDDHTQLILTEEGMVIGTPLYMSPEQLKGLSLTPAADVFSFGVVFYELLAGRLPFTGETRPALFAAILNAAPYPLDDIRVPRPIVELVFACLQKDADARPTMEDVVGQLRGTLTSLSLPTDALFGDSVLLAHIDRADAFILAEVDRSGVWVQLQRERGRAEMDAHAVTFDVDLRLADGTARDIPVGQMRRLLEDAQLATPDARIGRLSNDERFKLHRDTHEVYASLASGGVRAYWAAARDARFFYLTSVPLLERGAIPIEFLLEQTIESLQYAARYGSLVAGDRAVRLTVEITIRNAAKRPLVGEDWSHRFTSSLDAQNKYATDTVRSAISVSLPFLRDELPSCVRLLFDDLMTYFDFLTVPAEYYQHVFARIGGR